MTYIICWPHKDMDVLPGWEMSSMPGPRPRQHEHESQYTRHAPVHSNKANMKGWLWQPNYIRGTCRPKTSCHLCYRWGKTPKNPTCPERGLNPGPLWYRRECYRLFYSERIIINSKKIQKIVSKVYLNTYINQNDRNALNRFYNNPPQLHSKTNNNQKYSVF